MDIRVPALGEGADSGTVINIYVKVGDEVKKDQSLVDLENEKAVAAIPSTHAGKITQIYVKNGDKVTVGQSLVALAETGASAEPVGTHGVRPPTPPPAPEAPKMQAAAPQTIPGIPPPASPSVRKLAQEIALDLRQVKGSEHGGRITIEDVRGYIKNLQNAAVGAHMPVRQAGGRAPKPAESIDFSKWGPVKKEAISSLRKTIGDRMTESWTTIPHVTQFDEADITALTALRKKYAAAYEKKGTKLTVTSFILKAVVEALKKYPKFNASLDESTGELVYKEYYHIGVAVDTPQGLIVPVLRDVNKKSLFEISKSLEELAEKTRQRKVGIEELKGGTFTVSNLGGIGGGHFTPIVNKPEVAILGVGRGKLASTLPVALSYDHRVIDGADGARFIRTLCETLENFKEKEVKIMENGK
ncbi:MAG: 2-oxo acid dehydrogenase subunit E2 [Candidatus Omnitrophica bacterium]|nr:2-oxo acid dehydrogenase subunit E2 [Candidatus Omnitrophota bacterium]